MNSVTRWQIHSDLDLLTGGTVLNPATKRIKNFDVGVTGDRVTATKQIYRSPAQRASWMSADAT